MASLWELADCMRVVVVFSEPGSGTWALPGLHLYMRKAGQNNERKNPAAFPFAHTGLEETLLGVGLGFGLVWVGPRAGASPSKLWGNRGWGHMLI